MCKFRRNQSKNRENIKSLSSAELCASFSTSVNRSTLRLTNSMTCPVGAERGLPHTWGPRSWNCSWPRWPGQGVQIATDGPCPGPFWNLLSSVKRKLKLVQQLNRCSDISLPCEKLPISLSLINTFSNLVMLKLQLIPDFAYALWDPWSEWPIFNKLDNSLLNHFLVK